MKRTIWPLVALLILVLSSFIVAQVPNEPLANGILAARKKDAALMQQYTWNCRTEIIDNGKVLDTRIEQVNLGPDGRPQRVLLNDEKSEAPRGFLKKRIAERKGKELEEYLKGLGQLVEQYTLPSAGKVIDFIAKARIQPVTSPEGKTLLQMTGNSVVSPADTFTMTVDGATMKTRRVEIATFYEGDAATALATFATPPTGLNHLQYADVEVPARNITLQIHNYDYVPNQ
jgi:hypothetical protein